jgi:hypothetical protein
MLYDLSISTPLHERYADIALRPIFKSEDDLLRVCILYIDPKSPLSREKNIDFRLECALRDANLADPEGTKELINSGSPQWDRMVFEYFRFIFNTRYQAWFSLLESYHHLTRDLRSSDAKPRDRVLVSKEMNQIQKAIDEIELELFNSEDIRDRLYQQAVIESLTGYSEKYALESPDHKNNNQ